MLGLGIYKPCRPSQILRSEELVQNVIRILMKEYINPFGVGIDKERLINLSSGVPLNDEATELLSSSPDTGKEKRKEFVEKQLHQREILAYDAIKRCKFQNCTSMAKKLTVKNKKSIDVNHDILAKLLPISVTKGETIDFEKALKYPLGAIPLSLANADSTTRKTNKRKFGKIILSRMKTEPLPNFAKQKTARYQISPTPSKGLPGSFFPT